MAFYPVTIISDCHTKALRRKIDGPFMDFFLRLKRWSLGIADLIIVSNEALINQAREYNLHVFVLPDLVPFLNASRNKQTTVRYCVFVITYAEDEPIEIILQAAVILAKDIRVFLTGKPPGCILQQYKNYPNIILTGFLPDMEYNNLLANAACIAALTTEDNCLQCAGYEALELEIPLVTTDTAVLRDYFDDAAIYTNNTVESIVNSISTAIEQSDNLRKKLKQLKLQQRKNDIVRLGKIKAYFL